RWRIVKESLIESREEQRGVRKELVTIRAREYRRGASDRDDRVRLRPIRVDGADIVNHRCCSCAGAPAREDGDLHDVDGRSGTSIQLLPWRSPPSPTPSS